MVQEPDRLNVTTQINPFAGQAAPLTPMLHHPDFRPIFGFWLSVLNRDLPDLLEPAGPDYQIPSPFTANVDTDGRLSLEPQPRVLNIDSVSIPSLRSFLRRHFGFPEGEVLRYSLSGGPDREHSFAEMKLVECINIYDRAFHNIIPETATDDLALCRSAHDYALQSGAALLFLDSSSNPSSSWNVWYSRLKRPVSLSGFSGFIELEILHEPDREPGRTYLGRELLVDRNAPHHLPIPSSLIRTPVPQAHVAYLFALYPVLEQFYPLEINQPSLLLDWLPHCASGIPAGYPIRAGLGDVTFMMVPSSDIDLDAADFVEGSETEGSDRLLFLNHDWASEFRTQILDNSTLDADIPNGPCHISGRLLIENVLRDPLRRRPVITVAEPLAGSNDTVETGPVSLLTKLLVDRLGVYADVVILNGHVQEWILRHYGKQLPVLDGPVAIWLPGSAAIVLGDLLQDTADEIVERAFQSLLPALAAVPAPWRTDFLRRFASAPSELELLLETVFQERDELARRSQDQQIELEIYRADNELLHHQLSESKLNPSSLRQGELWGTEPVKLYYVLRELRHPEVEITRKALSSANKHPFGDVKKTQLALRAALEQVTARNWGWFKDQQQGDGWKYSPRESEATMNRVGDQRPNGQFGPAERHFTIARNSDRCVQIYIELDKSVGLMRILYCGKHLEHGNKRR